MDHPPSVIATLRSEGFQCDRYVCANCIWVLCLLLQIFGGAITLFCYLIMLGTMIPTKKWVHQVIKIPVTQIEESHKTLCEAAVDDAKAIMEKEKTKLNERLARTKAARRPPFGSPHDCACWSLPKDENTTNSSCVIT
jgi:hypothetical protein